MDNVSYPKVLWLGCGRLTDLYRDNDIDDVLDLTFSTDDERFGETVTIDLKPGGRDIEVTNDNKREYVEYVILEPDYLYRDANLN